MEDLWDSHAQTTGRIRHFGGPCRGIPTLNQLRKRWHWANSAAERYRMLLASV